MLSCLVFGHKFFFIMFLSPNLISSFLYCTVRIIFKLLVILGNVLTIWYLAYIFLRVYIQVSQYKGVVHVCIFGYSLRKVCTFLCGL